MTHADVLPLSEAPVGTRLRIRWLSAAPEVSRRLRELGLRERMQNDIRPDTGTRLFTPLTGICLMIYYVLAMQCLSTVAVMHRETNG
jgi:Fe2+ transport system protein B